MECLAVNRAARQIGARAQQWLADPTVAGKVHAVVSNAVYLQSASGEIVWLTNNPLLHPRAVFGDFDLEGLEKGMPFRRLGAHLDFDGGWSLDWSAARVWQPPPVPAGRPAPSDRVKARAARLRGAFPAQTAVMLKKVKDPGMPQAGSAPVVASPDALQLVKCAHAHDHSGLFSAARGLVGLGPGLTPSGDDLLGGLFFAAYHLHATYLQAFPWESRSVDGLLDWARDRTNPISFTLLSDHARGEGAAPLYDLVAGLLSAQELDLLPFVRRVTAIGSTTGADLLAGALAAFGISPEDD